MFSLWRDKKVSNIQKIEERKLKKEIFDVKNENLKALEKLFPSVVKDGQVDFQALKEELGEFEEVGSEKYGLTWSGKQNAKKIAQENVIGKTLKYVPEDSKNPETTENLYIEGDNLEVLKLLRQNYYNSIKMIYIVIFSLLEYCIHSYSNRAYYLSNVC